MGRAGRPLGTGPATLRTFSPPARFSRQACPPSGPRPLLTGLWKRLGLDPPPPPLCPLPRPPPLASSNPPAGFPAFSCADTLHSAAAMPGNVAQQEMSEIRTLRALGFRDPPCCLQTERVDTG